MTALAGVTVRVGETDRVRVYAVSIGTGQVAHALVDTATDPMVQMLRPRLIPRSARKVPAFYREQVLALLAEIATTDLDAVAIVTAQPAAPWHDHVTRQVPGLPVTVTHPGLAATWAEYHRRGRTGTLAHVTVSATVHAGIVLNGQLHPNTFGHIPIDPDSPRRCGTCATPGCVTALAAAPAVLRRYRELRTTASRIRRTSASPQPGSIMLVDLAQAAARGDDAARQAMQEAGHWLGIGLATVANLIGPDVITIGGALPAITARRADAGGYLAAIERAAHSHATPADATPMVINSAPDGAERSLFGAALLAVPRGPQGSPG
ncbi:ROK family protein [Frankia sp. R82]|uniref:ROK family protein n=1 Tax=Frankia sp. R82 TaxID=2950553 RepID=UPI0020437A09|nr:ROK family protein [Frankia sp. R82]MCM3884314.1 ROK family protein [Frankia sp. R82]